LPGCPVRERGTPGRLSVASTIPRWPWAQQDPRQAENVHNDPFDRLLIAQAMRLGFTLMTADCAIRTFGDVAQIWAE
jgi:hypothetical protein